MLEWMVAALVGFLIHSLLYRRSRKGMKPHPAPQNERTQDADESVHASEPPNSFTATENVQSASSDSKAEIELVEESQHEWSQQTAFPQFKPSIQDSVSKDIENVQATRGESAVPHSEDDEDIYSDDAYRKWNKVDPHCNGLKCNPEHQCNNGERLFCKEVVMPLNPHRGTNWIGQYWIRMFSEWRRVDFAVQNKDGKAIAIEFDGHGSHTNLDGKKFKEQLDRQNDLLMSGWSVLRFSYFHLRNPNECTDLIKGAINANNAMCTASLHLPVFFADVHLPRESNSNTARTLYSSKRKARYIPLSTISSPPPFDHFQYWLPCPDFKCAGRIWRAKDGYKNWKCDACKKSYFDNKNSLPCKQIIQRKQPT